MVSKPLRIAYLNCGIYNYLTATIIEGLNELGHEVVCSDDSNYGRVIDELGWRSFARQADIILVDTDQRPIRYSWLEGMDSERGIAVDGSDFQEVNVLDGFETRFILKRELNRRAPPHPLVFPFPFAAEKRYFKSASVTRDLAAVYLCNRKTNPFRSSIYHCLYSIGCAMGRTDIILGATGERPYVVHQPSKVAIETPMYHALLQRAKIAINVPGMGFDCARYWEILAAGAMLLTWEPENVIPNPFTDGVNCATFRSMEEFEDKFRFYLEKPDLCAKIAVAGTQHLKTFHTTAARASWFLALLEQQGVITSR
ncbi:MAG: glycosyltransferase [Pirellulaceae bacterium]|nr:glycosyltransferase [Pirellulaceae bacterium]